MPLEAMTFMQELASDGFPQAEMVTLAKFSHSADRLAPSVGIGLCIMRQLGQRHVKNFIDRAIPASGKLLLYDLFLIGLQLDGHIGNVRQLDGRQFYDFTFVSGGHGDVPH